MNILGIIYIQSTPAVIVFRNPSSHIWKYKSWTKNCVTHCMLSKWRSTVLRCCPRRKEISCESVFVWNNSTRFVYMTLWRKGFTHSQTCYTVLMSYKMYLWRKTHQFSLSSRCFVWSLQKEISYSNYVSFKLLKDCMKYCWENFAKFCWNIIGEYLICWIDEALVEVLLCCNLYGFVNIFWILFYVYHNYYSAWENV